MGEIKDRDYLDHKNRIVIKIGDVEEKIPGTDTLRIVRGKYAAVGVEYTKGKGIYIRVNETELVWEKYGLMECFTLGKGMIGAKLKVDDRKRRSQKKEKQIYNHLKDKLDLEAFRDAYLRHNGDPIEVENKALQGMAIVMDALGGFGTN